MNWLRLAIQWSMFNRANTNLNKSTYAARRSFTSHHSYFSLLQPCRKHQKYIAQIMLASYLSMPGVLLAQGVSAAANSVHAPGFDTAANGTPIVNINAPSSKGVSRNEYNDLNVETKGLIFNNATDIVNTQLAGFIDGNSRLNGNSANIILNEVKGNSRSALNGYMEIAGRSAELVIANQNGITCNGCGFINTTRGTLTTGLPTFDGAGGLTGFDVSRGDVDISGLGLNASNVDEVDILARSVSLNSKFWAKNATIVTGQNHINYQDKKVTAALGSSGSGISLDVAAIGGMYANRIRLIGTEKGLGVNFAGNVTAAEDMLLDQSGNITNKATLSAKNFTIKEHYQDTGVSLENQGKITVSNALTAKLDALENQATITANNVTLKANTLNNTGTAALQAVDSMQLDVAEDVTNQGKIAANNAITLNANSLDNNTNSQLQSAGNLTLTLANGLDNQGTVVGKNVTLNTTSVTNGSEAKLQATETLDLNLSSDLTNQGSIAANGAITLDANTLNTSSGSQLQTTDDLTITLANGLDNQGTVAGKNVTLNTTSVTNGSEAKLQATEMLDLNLNSDLTNQGSIAANGAIDIDANALNTSSGSQLQTTDDLTITLANGLDNQGTVAGKNVTLNTTDVINGSNAQLQATDTLDLNLSGDLTNQGIIAANGAIDIDANALNTSAGSKLQSSDDLQLTLASSLTNAGSLIGANVSINTTALTNNTSGYLQATDTLDVDVTGDLNNSGSLVAGNNMTMDAVNFTNATNAKTQASNDATLTLSGNLNNQALISAGNNLTVTANQFTNASAAKLKAANAVQANFRADTNNLGLVSGKNVNLTSSSVLNQASGTLQATDGLVLTTAGTLNNYGNMASSNAITVNAASLTNQAGAKLQADNALALTLTGGLDNSSLVAGGSGTVTATSINNRSNGTIQGGSGTLTISSAGHIENQGLMLSTNNLTLNGASLTNTGNGKIQALNLLSTSITGNTYNYNEIAGSFLDFTTLNFNNLGSKALVLGLQDIKLTTNASLLNQDGATIYSDGTATFTATGDVTNSSATIESARDLTVTARSLLNKRMTFVKKESSETSFNVEKVEWVDDTSSGYDQDFHAYVGTQLINSTSQVLSKSNESNLLSGKNISLTLSNDLSNDFSTISAIGNIKFTADTYSNSSFTEREIKVVNIYEVSSCNSDRICIAENNGKVWGVIDDWYGEWGDEIPPDPINNVISVVNSTFSAGGAIKGTIRGNAQNIGNVGSVRGSAVSSGNKTADNVNETSSSVDPSSVSITGADIKKVDGLSLETPVTESSEQVTNADINYPSLNDLIHNALFSVSSAPNPPYLIETNSFFTSYKSFISSDYMLEKLGLNVGGENAVRLGDGYYEQTMVRDQILDLTGKQTLSKFDDIEDMYQALMGNALDQYENLELSVGVTLTDGQIASLNAPIVWMVKQTYDTDSGPVTALVPQVYFPASMDMLLREDGALIAANSITLNVGGGIINSGSIVADADANINTDEDFINSGGLISANALSIDAGGDFISKTQVEKFGFGHSFVGETASITAKTLSINAGNDLVLAGSDLVVTGDVSLAAANDIRLEALDTVNRNGLTSTTDHLTSTLQGDNISITSGNTFTSEAATIKATDLFAIDASTIDLLAVQDTTGKKRSGLSKFSVTNQVTDIKAGSMSLNADDVVTLEGTQIAVEGDLSLDAKHIDLLTVVDRSDYYKKNGGGGNSTEIRTHNEALTGTTLSAGGSLTLVSQQDIFSQGSTLNGGEGITLAAGGDIMLASAEAYNSSFQEVKTKSSGFFGSKSSTKTTTSESLTNLGTSLTSGGDIQLSAGADILLSGTKASAAGDIGLQAVGGIQLLSAVDQTSSQYQEQKKGTFKVKAKDQGSIKQTAVTSELAGANISLTSGSNIALQGATLTSNNTLSMGAATGTLQAVTQDTDGHYVNANGEQVGNVTVGTQALQSSEWSKSSSGFRGIFKDLVKIIAVGVAVGTGGLVHGEIKVGEADSTRTDSLTQQISTLAGNDLVIKAKDTLALIGTKISATNLASLSANDITIDAAHEQTVVSNSHTEQTVSGKGATLQKDQISLASITETDQTERTTTTANTWQGSNISAGSLNLSANNNLAILASDINVDNNANIKGENILVGGREATTDTTHDSITKTKTLTVGVKNAYVDVVLAAQALKDAKDAVSDAKDAYDDAKQKVAEGKLPASDLDFYKVNLAAATANVASATTAVYASGAAAAAAASTSMGTGFYVSGGATTQTDTTSTTSTQGTWNGSNINVGGNTSLASNNNLNIEGSNINTAGQLALNANNINITAGKNTYTENTESQSEGGGISVSIQPTTTSFSGSVNASQSRSDYQSTDYVNSQIGAGSLVSNSDNLTIKGGNVSADEVDITTGSLTVESLQNTSSGSSSGAGFSVSASLGGSDKGWEGSNDDPTKSPAASGVTGFGGNASKGNSEKAWVAQQSGIIGGTVNITAKDTSLTGAVIAAQNSKGEDNGQLTLTTGTLTVADIKDTDTSQNIGLGYSVSGLAIGEALPDNTGPDAKDPMDPSQSTYSASFNGHDKQQTTKATIGQGNVTVGGTSIDEQAQFADLNRDTNNSQETTKDMELGGLDMSLTVDNRMLSKAGWKDIAEDVEKTNTAVVDGVDYVADEIAVMGDNLPEELRGTLGQTGEDFVDGLIRQDLSQEEIEELLAKEKIRQGLAGAESANQALSGQTGQTDSQGKDVASTASTASTDTTITDESGEVNLGVITVTGSTEVTALQVGSAGLGKIQQELDELRETNPEKAKVVETVIGLATGGPLKTAIGEAINQGIELASSASDNVANAMGTVAGYADDALNWVGGIIEKDNAENFALNVADEHANPTEELGELGNSSVDVKDGVRLIATISGAGIGVGKKQTGTKEVSGEGHTGPYDAKSTRADLEATNGAENVTSTTVVQNPRQTVNSGPQKNIEVIHDSYGNKAVRVEYKDPVTGESKVANIAYDSQRGLPVFDGYAKYTTNIKKPNGYENMPSSARKSAEMRAATRDLREKIDSGVINQNDFTPAQLRAINSGKENIPGYTWHHNAQSAPNNMQLLPKDVHDAAKHIGEASLSEGR